MTPIGIVLIGVIAALLVLSIEVEATRRELRAGNDTTHDLLYRVREQADHDSDLTFDILLRGEHHLKDLATPDTDVNLGIPDGDSEAVTDKIHRPAPARRVEDSDSDPDPASLRLMNQQPGDYAVAGEVHDALYRDRVRLLRDDPDEYFRQYPAPDFSWRRNADA